MRLARATSAGLAAGTVNPAIAILLALAWRPIAYGASISEVARVLGFILAYVFVPGCLAYRALRPRSDALSILGMGGALGLALLGSVRFLLGVAGLERAFPAWPLVALLVAWFLRRRERTHALEETATPLPPLRPVHWLWIGAVCLVAIGRTPLYQMWGSDGSVDVLFHAGNAAEFSNHWPLQNPRVAGFPLTYHFFGYTLAAACREVTGVPMHALCLRLLPTFVPALLAVEVVAAARLLGVANRGAILASILVILYSDVGHAARTLLGFADTGPVFYGYFDVGLFESPPTSMGFVYFLGLAVFLTAWLDESRRGRTIDLAVAALFAAAASATKGSVMPVAVGGLAIVGVVNLIRRRRVQRIAVAGAVLCLVSLPMTLWLVLGPESYAQAMFRFVPGDVLRQGFRAPGGLLVWNASRWSVAAASPIWLVGYLGPVAPACILAWRRSAGASVASATSVSPPIQTAALGWLLASGACGLALALAFAAPGLSQLFFAYTGQIGLALVAGAALCLAPFPSRWFDRAFVVATWMLLALMTAGAAWSLVGETRRDLEAKRELDAGTDLYANGLEWIRTSSSKDAVVVTRLEKMIVSVMTERRTFFETDAYTAAMHRSRVPGAKKTDEGRQRLKLLRDARSLVFQSPSVEHLRAVREAAGDVSDVLFVWDDAVSVSAKSPAGGFEFRPCAELPDDTQALLGEPLYANAVMRIYAIPPRAQ
jgi:hypothetical protein